MKDILYSIGKTSLGDVVYAKDAERHTPYSCLGCGQAFVLRRGRQKRPHFAHKVLTPNCTAETALHKSFKTLLFDRIQRHIEQRSHLEMKWDCHKCGTSHGGNLIKKAASVALEHSLGTCKPDIALLNDAGNPVAVIEVVVTHFPEEAALDYYAQNNIPMLLYVLYSDEELNRIEEAPLKPDDVTICLHPQCPQCGQHQARKQLLIIDGDCWQCGHSMKVAAIDGDRGNLSSDDFSKSDLLKAQQHGVFITSRYSKTAKRQYLANTCHRCNAFVGTNYLFTDYIANPSYIQRTIDVSYYCPVCS